MNKTCFVGHKTFKKLITFIVVYTLFFVLSFAVTPKFFYKEANASDNFSVNIDGKVQTAGFPTNRFYLKVFMWGDAQKVESGNYHHIVYDFNYDTIPYVFDQKFELGQDGNYQIKLENLNPKDLELYYPYYWDNGNNNPQLEKYEKHSLLWSNKLYFSVAVYDINKEIPVHFVDFWDGMPLVGYAKDKTFFPGGADIEYGHPQTEGLDTDYLKTDDDKLAAEAYWNFEMDCAFNCHPLGSETGEPKKWEIPITVSGNVEKCGENCIDGDEFNPDYDDNQISLPSTNSFDNSGQPLVIIPPKDINLPTTQQKAVGDSLSYSEFSDVSCYGSASNDHQQAGRGHSFKIEPKHAGQEIDCTVLTAFKDGFNSKTSTSDNYGVDFRFDDDLKNLINNSFLYQKFRATSTIAKANLTECPISISTVDQVPNQMKPGDKFQISPLFPDFWKSHNIDPNNLDDLKQHIAVQWVRVDKANNRTYIEGANNWEYQTTPYDTFPNQIIANVTCHDFVGYNNYTTDSQNDYQIYVNPNPAIVYNLKLVSIAEDGVTKLQTPRIGAKVGFEVLVDDEKKQEFASWTLTKLKIVVQNNQTKAEQTIFEDDKNPNINTSLTLKASDMVDQNLFIFNTLYVETTYSRLGYADAVVTTDKNSGVVRKGLGLGTKVDDNLRLDIPSGGCSVFAHDLCIGKHIGWAGYISTGDVNDDWVYNCTWNPGGVDRQKTAPCSEGYTINEADYGQTIYVNVKTTRVGYDDSTYYAHTENEVGDNVYSFDNEQFQFDSTPEVNQVVGLVGTLPDALDYESGWNSSITWYYANNSCHDSSCFVQISDATETYFVIPPELEGNGNRLIVRINYTKTHYEAIMLQTQSAIIKRGEADNYHAKIESNLNDEQKNPRIGSLLSLSGLPNQDSTWKQISCVWEEIGLMNQIKAVSHNCDTFYLSEETYGKRYRFTSEYTKPHFQNMIVTSDETASVTKGILPDFEPAFALEPLQNADLTIKSACSKMSGCLYYGQVYKIEGLPSLNNSNTAIVQVLESSNPDMLNYQTVDIGKDLYYSPSRENIFIQIRATIYSNNFEPKTITSNKNVYLSIPGVIFDFDPQISGEYKVGETLTVTGIYSSLQNYQNTIIWNSSGVNCKNPQSNIKVGRSYVLTSADAGCILNASVTAQKENMQPLTKTTKNAVEVTESGEENSQENSQENPNSKSSQNINGGTEKNIVVNNESNQTKDALKIETLADKIELVGQNKPGRTIRLAGVSEDITTKVFWERVGKCKTNGVDNISSKTYYLVKNQDKGCDIKVVVELSNQNITSSVIAFKISADKNDGKRTNIPKDVEIIGTPQIGSMLIANSEIILPGVQNYNYQWYVNNQKIKGAVHKYLLIEKSMLNKTVFVKISGASIDKNNHTKVSPSSKITRGNPVNYSSKIIKQATANIYKLESPVDKSQGWQVSYLWQYNGKTVGANSPLVKLKEKAKRGLLSVTVKFTKKGYLSQKIVVQFR